MPIRLKLRSEYGPDANAGTWFQMPTVDNLKLI
jgi:hypothetical protein